MICYWCEIELYRVCFSWFLICLGMSPHPLALQSDFEKNRFKFDKHNAIPMVLPVYIRIYIYISPHHPPSIFRWGRPRVKLVNIGMICIDADRSIGELRVVSIVSMVANTAQKADQKLMRKKHTLAEASKISQLFFIFFPGLKWLRWKILENHSST